MEPLKIFKNTKALWWYSDNTLIVCKKHTLFFLYVETNKFEKIINLPVSNMFQRIFVKFRLLRRLFRLEPSCFTKICDSEYLFCLNSCIYCVNITSKRIVKECVFREGLRKTLSICSNGKRTFFGEYWTGNNTFHNVNIYERHNGKWKSCFTFNNNQIRHIHKLLILDNDLFCFTGDEICETKIVRFRDFDFSKPEIVYANSQIYRSCCAVCNANYIFYTTDTPYEDNKFVSFNVNNKDFKIIKTIESSSIYSSDIANGSFYFSTVVEPNLVKENGVNKRIKISNDLGGIHSNFSTLYRVNTLTNSFFEIFKLKKDFFPFIFGLGTFIPVANNSNSFLAIYSSCLKKDGSTIIFKLTNDNLN